MKVTKLLNITKDALSLTDFNVVGKTPSYKDTIYPEYILSYVDRLINTHTSNDVDIDSDFYSTWEHALLCLIIQQGSCTLDSSNQCTLRTVIGTYTICEWSFSEDKITLNIKQGKSHKIYEISINAITIDKVLTKKKVDLYS